jgi:hypothetical protein
MAETAPRAIRPNSVPQETFLASAADIAVYGGSAGGGKSWALLLDAMRFAANPAYGAVLFRRTSPQITNEGGLWDESGKLYPLAGATPLVGSLDWRFPSGANIGFRHLQHEATKYNWQGAQVPMLGFDELTHFSESQFWYLVSRNRSTCGVRPWIRGTCNADAGSWVKTLVGPWVDRKHPLFPTPHGAILWLVRKDGKYHWGRTREELAGRFPGIPPKSVTFVRADVFDNKDLLRVNPEYLANLYAQSPVEQARLLRGDWDVVNEGLVYPGFGSCVVEDEDWPEWAAGDWDWGGIDWGWNNPFGALAAVERDDVLWVGWERHGSRITLTEHSKALPRGKVRWWADPAGADQVAELRAAGHDVVPCTHRGSQPLQTGIALVSDRIRTGRLKVRGSLGHTIDEAGKYRYPPDKPGEAPIDKDNHLLAALRYMVVGVDRGRSVADAPPPESDEARAAREAIETKAREEAEAAYYHPDAEHWWE